MSKPITIALINNKGGAGKSKSTEHLAWCMAEAGHQVTAIDSDGQANLTSNLGVQPDAQPLPHTLSDVLSGACSAYDATLYRDPWPYGLGLIPSSNRLDDTADEMALHPLRISRLATVLDGVDWLDVALVDTPPNVGPLVLSALLAADYVIFPATPMPESIAGIGRTLRQIADVRQETGKAPALLGIIATQVEAHTVAHQGGARGAGQLPRPPPRLHPPPGGPGRPRPAPRRLPPHRGAGTGRHRSGGWGMSLL